MGEYLEAAKLLGVAPANRPFGSDVQYLELVGKGLPVKCLDVIAHAVAPSDASFKYRIVSKATAARLKHRRKLSPEQGVVVTRLASIWDLALRVWKSADEARGFLDRPHPMLEGRRPIDLVLENELGARLVRGVLGRLQAGTAV